MAVSSASFLPEDVLILIFKACSPFGPLPHLGPDKCRPPPWIPVTQVCRHWRSTALSTPSLWAQIAYGQLSCRRCSRWGEEILNRAGNGIALHVHSTVRIGSPGWNALIKNMGRTREMVHEDASVSDLRAIMASASSAPILESLFIGFSIDIRMLSLPFGQRECPKLKELFLVIPLRFNWPSVSSFTQLVILTVEGSIEDPETDFPKFLSALNVMRVLEKLHVEISVPPGKQEWTWDQHLGATLPKLNHLSLLANYSSCISLLPRIHFNRRLASISLTVEDDSSRPQGNPISTFAQQLLSDFRAQDAESVVSEHNIEDSSKELLVDLTARSHSRFAVEASAGSPRVTFFFQLFPHPDAEPRFALSYNVFGALTEDMLTYYTEALPIASVQTVCIRAFHVKFHVWTRQLLNPFDHLPSATTLQLTKTDTADGAEIFSCLKPREGRLPLPDLRKVVIEGTRHAVSRISPFLSSGIMQEVVFQCPSLAALRDCIVARRALGCRIERIVCARSCDLEAGHVNDLRALGLEVDWLPSLILTRRPVNMKEAA